MKKVGLIGSRGMVGSILLERMEVQNDFAKIAPYFFSTSNVGGMSSNIAGKEYVLLDAYDIENLANMDIIITTQGGEYTHQVFPKLQEYGWQGYWIDASSALRMSDASCIILDPVNHKNIIDALNNGIKVFTGGNCSITLALLGLSGLFKAGLIEWMSMVTYQAASGAGAKNVRELILQHSELGTNVAKNWYAPDVSILSLLKHVDGVFKSGVLSTDAFGLPLVGNIHSWIDSDLGNGMSREEWKGEVELNKILGLAKATIKVDGFCVRVPTLRCHATAITMKLKQNLALNEVADLIKNDHEWVQFVDNDKQSTLTYFTPLSVSGSLKIGVGRLKKMDLEENGSIYGVMTLGDQLLWGAAEPLRRMLNILVDGNW